MRADAVGARRSARRPRARVAPERSPTEHAGDPPVGVADEVGDRRPRIAPRRRRRRPRRRASGPARVRRGAYSASTPAAGLIDTVVGLVGVVEPGLPYRRACRPRPPGPADPTGVAGRPRPASAREWRGCRRRGGPAPARGRAARAGRAAARLPRRRSGRRPRPRRSVPDRRTDRCARGFRSSAGHRCVVTTPGGDVVGQVGGVVAGAVDERGAAPVLEPQADRVQAGRCGDTAPVPDAAGRVEHRHGEPGVPRAGSRSPRRPDGHRRAAGRAGQSPAGRDHRPRLPPAGTGRASPTRTGRCRPARRACGRRPQPRSSRPGRRRTGRRVVHADQPPGQPYPLVPQGARGRPAGRCPRQLQRRFPPGPSGLGQVVDRPVQRTDPVQPPQDVAAPVAAGQPGVARPRRARRGGRPGPTRRRSAPRTPRRRRPAPRRPAAAPGRGIRPASPARGRGRGWRRRRAPRHAAW